jgi:RHS repeat-associated protein
MTSGYSGRQILCPPSCKTCKGPGAETNSSSTGCAGQFTTSKCGSSVLLSSGAFSFRRKLLSVAAVNNISWEFGIDYLAGNGVNDILGKGFNFPQYLRLVPGAGGNVVLATGENTLDTFVPSGSGYAADPYNCTQAELAHSESGPYFLLYASDGSVTTFHDFTATTPGRLVRIADRYANTQSYEWQVAGTLCQLTSVTDAYGRVINYSYYGSEFNYLLSQITDFLGRQLNFQYDNLGHLTAIVTPSVMQAATGNTFPGGTAYVFQYDVNNPRPERQDDLVGIWFPTETAPYIDTATRTVNVAAVYASATPRYTVQYGQDPTDADTWGCVTSETVGDPANGVGGTFEYMYFTSGLPDNLIDPDDTIEFRCVVTDRNDNQVIYDFNVAQMPVRIEVLRSRGKISIPASPSSFVTWIDYNNQNQPVLTVLPEGNSVQNFYENGMISGFSQTYNRRVGLLISRTQLPGNSLGIPARSGSSGQSQLTESYFYEPIYNQVCAMIERRGNPIDATGDYFSPQNGGSASASRYATITLFDYQKDLETTVQGDTALQTRMGFTSGTPIGNLYTFVNAQLSAAGLTGFGSNLGDINGEGTGSGTSTSATHLGNVVKFVRPSVTQFVASPPSIYREELFTTNKLGQATTHTDSNGNMEIFVRYPYNDPEGNGGILEPESVIPADLGGKQYGRLKEIHVDGNPNDVLSLVGSDGDLVDFTQAPVDSNIVRTNTPGVYQDLVTRFEGGAAASGSGCSSCAYDPMGNPLATTDPRGFTTRFDRNELGEVYRTISPQPYNFRVETYFDANRNVVRVDTEDLQPAYDSSDPTSARFAQFTPSGSGNTAHVAMRPSPGGSVRPRWFTNLFTFDLLDNKTQDDIDATGSTPANLITGYLYDPNQNLIQITKPEGNIVEFDYDERDFQIAVRVGRDAASDEPGAVTVTAHDGNGNVLEVIGPASRGGTADTAVIEDAFRGGSTASYTGDRVVRNTIDGFDRVIEALDPLDNYVDTGVGYTSGNPFLDPDGRVIQLDRHGTKGDGTTTIVLLASSQFRFDEAGRQYEMQANVFYNGAALPSGRTVTHNNGGLEMNSTTNGHTGSVNLTSGGNSYVLARNIFDPGGRTITRLADIVLDSANSETTIEFDGADRAITVTDALGSFLSNTFDAGGNLIAAKRTELPTIDGANVETFSSAMFYDCLNQLVLAASQGADGNLNPDVMAQAAAGVSFWEMSSWNLSTSTLISCLAHDSRGNQVLNVDPKANSVVQVFDGASRNIQTQQHLRQDGQGQNPPEPNQTLLPASAGTIVTTVILDGNSRPTQLIDDRGAVTRWEFDTLDRVTATIFQDGSMRTNVYDEASDVTLFTDENGSTFANSFDSLGRKFSVSIVPGSGVSGATTSQSFRFDGLSRVTDAQNNGTAGSSDVQIYYDSLGRVLEDSQTFGGNTRNVTTTGITSYPVTQFQFPGPGDRLIDNTLDLLYRRASVVEHSTSTAIASWNFVGPSRVADVALANGLTCTWMNDAVTSSAVQCGSPGVPNPPWGSITTDRLGYDGAGRMIAKRYKTSASGHPTLVGFTTAFDRAGSKFYERPLHAEERGSVYQLFDASSNLPTAGYDSLDRLLQYKRGVLASTGGDGGNGGGSISTPIELTGTDAERSYGLDSLGNWRQTAFIPAGASGQTEIRQHNLLNEITRISNPNATPAQINPTYDVNGNLLNDGFRAYTWDALNRLSVVNRVSDGDQIAAYSFDALNRRIRRVVSNGGLPGTIPNGTTDFVYSGWRCLEDRNPFGGGGSTDTAIMQYVWGIYLDELLQMLPLVAVNDFPASSPLYPLQDLLYRTAGLADTSSPPVVREAYDTDAYGNTLIFRNTSGGSVTPINWNDSDTQVSFPSCQFIFTGQRLDAETELYYYKRRYYSPSPGRFLSRDPVANDLDLYRYAWGKPATRIDPLGMITLGPEPRTGACTESSGTFTLPPSKIPPIPVSSEGYTGGSPTAQPDGNQSTIRWDYGLPRNFRYNDYHGQIACNMATDTCDTAITKLQAWITNGAIRQNHLTGYLVDALYSGALTVQEYLNHLTQLRNTNRQIINCWVVVKAKCLPLCRNVPKPYVWKIPAAPAPPPLAWWIPSDPRNDIYQNVGVVGAVVVVVLGGWVVAGPSAAGGAGAGAGLGGGGAILLPEAASGTAAAAAGVTIPMLLQENDGG